MLDLVRRLLIVPTLLREEAATEIERLTSEKSEAVQAFAEQVRENERLTSELSQANKDYDLLAKQVLNMESELEQAKTDHEEWRRKERVVRNRLIDENSSQAKRIEALEAALRIYKCPVSGNHGLADWCECGWNKALACEQDND